MTTYVLVAGAWQGAWCWGRITPALRAAGHTVFTPTLTGLGERAHLLHPDVGLETHVQDVLATLFYEDLSRVVLTGHTSGAQVAEIVAGRAPERVAHLVAVDGLIPPAGQSQVDLIPAAARAHFEAQVRSAGDGWKIPPHDEEDLDVADRAVARWVATRLTPHPWRAFTDVLPAPAAAPGLRRTHFSLTVEQGPLMAGGAARARATGWDVRELAALPSAAFTAPEVLARALLDLA
jgi:pimeloyl-ACP methyl ester carboxylesterase